MEKYNYTVKYTDRWGEPNESDFRSLKESLKFAIRAAKESNEKAFVDEYDHDGIVYGTFWWEVEPDGSWRRH